MCSKAFSDTMRYTVMFDTRNILAISGTFRKSGSSITRP